MDLDALRGNLAWLRHRAGPAVQILAVVKADAYGHGLKEIAAVLMQSGVDVFGVANLEEALAVRKVGKGWPILILGAALPGEVESAIEHGLALTLSSLDEARLFSEIAERLRKPARAHLKIDTGMSRLGAAPEEALALFEAARALPRLQLEGVCTHFASAEENAAFTRRQKHQFHASVAAMQEAGADFEYIHASNSAAVLRESDPFCNTIRPGLLVYGIVPAGRRPRGRAVEGLRPALSWKCRIGLVKTLKRGAKVSYGGTFTAPREMRVAILTAGYGDGYLRSGSSRACVLIGGKRCPILGRITMDQMVADVSAVEHPQAGGEAVLIGAQGGERITTSDVAEWCGTIPWEILTNITYRVPRVYLGSHAA